MTKEIAKAINTVSKKVNEIQKKIDSYFTNRCEDNEISINDNSDCIIELGEMSNSTDECSEEIAEIVSDNADSLMELGEYIASLEERISALENINKEEF